VSACAANLGGLVSAFHFVEILLGSMTTGQPLVVTGHCKVSGQGPEQPAIIANFLWPGNADWRF
jgi:hypothetical protein